VRAQVAHRGRPPLLLGARGPGGHGARRVGHLAVGAVLGAIIIAFIQNGLALLAVSPAWSTVATGVVIIIAVTLDYLMCASATRSPAATSMQPCSTGCATPRTFEP
jgi:hypothetical protein